MPILKAAIQKEFLATCEKLEYGRLRLKTPEGAFFNFGDSGPEAEMHIHHPNLPPGGPICWCT